MVARVFIALLLLGVALSAHAGPRIDHWTLANGARVYFVETHDLPMVQVRAIFDAGAARDPAGRGGLAGMVSHMLNQGTGKLDADAVAADFERLGAQFGAGSDRDMASVDLRSLADPTLLKPALDLYTRVLREPSFPAEALARERERVLVGLKRDEQNPGSVIEKAFQRALYGDHPYGRDPTGSAASLQAMARDDLAAFHRRHYVGRNAWFVIVGDLAPGAARRLAEETVGKLPAGEAVAPLPAARAPAGGTKRVEFPATQSHIRIGTPVMKRIDPDYFPLYVGNYILGGGGLVSRLSDAVREKRGLAYSVYSYLMPMREQGPFVLGLQTKGTQREEALKVVRQVMNEFIAQGPTEKELDAAKKHITGGFPLRLDSNRKIADNLAVMAFYGLPLTWLEEYPKRVEAVTVEQIRDAFRRRLSPGALVTVTVGG